MQIDLDLQGDDIKLRSDASVTLAMVLHELCFNAISHGVPEGGTITVRSRVSEDGMIRIEVIDDGGAEAQSDSGTAILTRISSEVASTGIGLSLVRGLVGRELHGEFSIEANSGGGTIATVVFSGVERKRS